MGSDSQGAEQGAEVSEPCPQHPCGREAGAVSPLWPCLPHLLFLSHCLECREGVATGDECQYDIRS